MSFDQELLTLLSTPIEVVCIAVAISLSFAFGVILIVASKTLPLNNRHQLGRKKQNAKAALDKGL